MKLAMPTTGTMQKFPAVLSLSLFLPPVMAHILFTHNTRYQAQQSLERNSLKNLHLFILLPLID